MTLYLIGLGLVDEKDISVKGLEIVKKCAVVYADNYTSLLQCSLSELEKYYRRRIIPAPRELTERGAEKLVLEAKKKEVAFLIMGDPFSATTHIELFRLAREKGIPVKVIHNASILTAVGITGLQLYKFGRTTSIPFWEDNPSVETPYDVLKENKKRGLHTLFLLDLKPGEKKFMTIKEAWGILGKIEERRKERIVHENLLVVGCARLGSDDLVVKSGEAGEIKKVDFGRPPYCLIIPGKLHFLEEEVVKGWSLGRERKDSVTVFVKQKFPKSSGASDRKVYKY